MSRARETVPAREVHVDREGLGVVHIDRVDLVDLVVEHVHQRTHTRRDHERGHSGLLGGKLEKLPRIFAMIRPSITTPARVGLVCQPSQVL